LKRAQRKITDGKRRKLATICGRGSYKNRPNPDTSKVSLPDRKDVRIRLPQKELVALDRVCDQLGQTRQTFLAPQICDLIEEAERKIEARSSRKKTSRGTHSSEGPTGLGLGLNLRREPETVRHTEPAPVVVNVGTHDKTDFDELAEYIVSGHDYERDSRMRSAVDKLARKLEDVVAKRTVEPEDGGLSRLKRGAAAVFPGLKGLLDS